MNKLITALSLAAWLLAMPGNTSSQQENTLKFCDMRPVNFVRDSIEKVTQAHVNTFLLTFDSRCSNNIEFTESSNAMLFKLLLYKPKLVIHAMDNVKGVNTPLLLEEIKTPFLEPNYAKLISAVQAVKTKSKAKSDIIHAVTEARSNK